MNLIYVGNHDYCKACNLALPITKATAEELSIPIIYYDTDEHMQEIATLSIESLPTLLIIKEGVEVGRIVGSYPSPTLRKKLLEFI